MPSEQKPLAVPLLSESRRWLSSRSLDKLPWSWPFWQALPIPLPTPRGGPKPLAPQGSQEWRWWLLLPILTLQFGGLALVLPALPNLKLRFFGGNIVRAAHMQSVTDATRALLTMMVSGKLGRLSDAIGRRPLVILSVVCTLAPLVSLLVSADLYWYYLLYALAGALGGQYSPAISAYVADCCPPERRAKSLGILGATVGSVFMLMPLVGGVLSVKYGQQQVFSIATAVEVLAAEVVVLTLPESLPKDKQHGLESVGSTSVRPWQYLAGCDGRMRQLIIMRFLRGLAVCGTMTVMPFALMHFVALSDSDFGLITACNGFAGIFGQAVLLRLLLKYVCSEMAVLLFDTCMAAAQIAGFLFLAVSPSRRLIFALVLMSSTCSMGEAAFTAVVMRGIQEDFGLLFGVIAAVDSLTSCVAPLAFSLLFSAHPLAPFALAASLNAASAVMVAAMWLASRRLQHKLLAVDV